MPLEISIPSMFDPHLAGQSVEVALAELPDRSDVVPVVGDLVAVERDVALEQRREDVLRPVDEVADRGSGRRSRARTRRCRSFRGSTAPPPGPAFPGIPGCGRRRRGSRRRAGSGRPPRLSASVPIPPASPVPRPQRAEVDVGERVAGDDQERLVAEEVAHVADSARRPEQLLLVRVARVARRSAIRRRSGSRIRSGK